MESTPRLYDTLVAVLRQHQNWQDRRHLKTLAWMIVGLIQAGKIRPIAVAAWRREMVSPGIMPMKSGNVPALSMPANMIVASRLGGPWKYRAAQGARIAANENTTVAGLRPIVLAEV